ncbi:MAG TPA: DUF333 domain-containing protein [Methanothrix sp.]|nr:DUF333 domain-containing protein [Methanothrix sp.]
MSFCNLSVAGQEEAGGEECYRLAGDPEDIIKKVILGYQLYAAYLSSPLSLPDELERDDNWSQPAERMCNNSGGTVRSVHTPYGNIAMCVFPDGVTCDLKSITEGKFGEDAWTRYARSWLNAP